MHGFRRLQSLIRSKDDDFWGAGLEYNKLAMGLLDHLEDSPMGNPVVLKMQILLSVSQMELFHPDRFSSFYTKALCSLMMARRWYHNTSHMACGIDRIAMRFICCCPPKQTLIAILGMLEIEGEGLESARLIILGFHILTELCYNASHHADGELSLGESERQRLGNLAFRLLLGPESVVRRAATMFALEFRGIAGSFEQWLALVTQGQSELKAWMSYGYKKDMVQRVLRRAKGSIV